MSLGFDDEVAGGYQDADLEMRELEIAGNRAASERPHRYELDRWMTDPADKDYVEPKKRWCRVCLRHPDHSIHSAERRAAGR